MRSKRSWSTLFAAAAWAAALACGGAPGDEPAAAADATAVKAATFPWTFTKIPAGPVTSAIAAPASGVDAMAFEVTASGAKDTRITRVAFMLMGTLQPGEVVNLQLVHFPKGLGKPGVVVGTNDGAGWAPGALTSIVEIVLATPIAWSGQNLKTDLALRVDVAGSRTFFFQPRLQMVMIESNGVSEYLLAQTCDLPLNGDTLLVN